MYKLIQPETDKEYKKYYRLRWELLRKAWNEPEGSEKDAIENQCIHVLALDANRAVGVGRLQFNSEKEAQIRYMGIDSQYERTGIGSLIINELEQHASNKKCADIVLDAREPAIGFYEKHGYSITQKSYVLFDDIQHFRMIKTISH